MDYIVIKIGGSILETLPSSIYQDIVTLKKDRHKQPVIIHGGGPMITAMLNSLNIKTVFSNGLRKTTEEVLDVAEMVLSGSINKFIVRNIANNGGNAIGISGMDGHLLEALPSRQPDIGFVGEITKVNRQMLVAMFQQDAIPVISPIAISEAGMRLNVNADTAAAAIANALQAPLYMVTDVDGVQHDDAVVDVMTIKEAEALIHKGVICGGMIPKVKAAIEGLRKGAGHTVIFNGNSAGNLLQLAAGKQIGTKIIKDEKKVREY